MSFGKRQGAIQPTAQPAPLRGVFSGFKKSAEAPRAEPAQWSSRQSDIQTPPEPSSPATGANQPASPATAQPDMPVRRIDIARPEPETEPGTSQPVTAAEPSAPQVEAFQAETAQVLEEPGLSASVIARADKPAAGDEPAFDGRTEFDANPDQEGEQSSIAEPVHPVTAAPVAPITAEPADDAALPASIAQILSTFETSPDTPVSDSPVEQVAIEQATAVSQSDTTSAGPETLAIETPVEVPQSPKAQSGTDPEPTVNPLGWQDLAEPATNLSPALAEALAEFTRRIAPAGAAPVEQGAAPARTPWGQGAQAAPSRPAPKPDPLTGLIRAPWGPGDMADAAQAPITSTPAQPAPMARAAWGPGATGQAEPSGQSAQPPRRTPWSAGAGTTAPTDRAAGSPARAAFAGLLRENGREPEAASGQLFGMPAIPKNGKAPEPEPEANPSSAREGFMENIGPMRLTGELIGFIGLMVAAFVYLYWPADPQSVKALGNMIYVPDAMARLAPFTQPRGIPLTASEASQIRANTDFLPILWVVGVAAVWRRRWALGGLIAAFFAFPWHLLGFNFPGWGGMLAIMVVIAIIRSPIMSKRKFSLLIYPAMFFLGPMVLSVIGGPIVKAMGPSQGGDVVYRAYSFHELEPNSKPTRTDVFIRSSRSALRDDPSQRTNTLAVIPEPVGMEGAKAYVMAQEYALRGDTAKAQAALAEVDASGFKPSRTDRKRLDTVRDYVAARGGQGDAARATVMRNFANNSILAWVALIFGVALAALAPISDTLVTRMTERRNRIRAAQEALAQGRVQQSMLDNARAGSTSFAARDGQAVADAAGRRSFVLAASALGALVIAGICYYFAAKFLMPAVDANTAFTNVGMTSDMMYLDVDDTLRGPGVPFGFSLFMPAIFILIIVRAKASKRYADIASYAFAALIFVPIAMAARAPYLSVKETAASSFDTTMRAKLEAVTEGAPAAGLIPDARSGSSPFGAPSRARVEVDDAGYALAQIAYIENRPENAARYLAAIKTAAHIEGEGHQQRVDIIREWVAAKGLTPPPQAWPSTNPRMYHQIGRYLSWATWGSALLGLGLAGAAFMAFRRRQRIGDLVEQRKGLLTPGMA